MTDTRTTYDNKDDKDDNNKKNNDEECDGLQWTTQQSNRKNVGRLRTRMDDKTRRMTDDKEDDGHENNG